MSINHNVSPTQRVPGKFVEFNTSAAARGLAAVTNRIALVGQMTSAGTATTLVAEQIFSEAEADTKFGVASELSLMCKRALRSAKAYGKSPEIWGCPITNPGVDGTNTKSAYTYTLTGTATEAGTLSVRVHGKVISVGVANAATAATVAVDLEAAIDAELKEIPFTASETGAVVTLLNNMTGAISNDGLVETVFTPAGLANAVAQSVTAIGAVDITAQLDALANQDYDIVALANHEQASATDVADGDTHLTSMWGAGTKRWRTLLMADCATQSAAQALATSMNDFKWIMVSLEAGKEPESIVAATVGAVLAGEDDPAQSFNDIELPGLALPAVASFPLQAELDSGIGGGLLMLAPNEKQDRIKIVRAVTTKVTESNVGFFAMLDWTIPRSMAYAAKQVEIAQTLAFPRSKKNAQALKRIYTVTLDVLFKLEELEILQNVEDHKDELIVETDSIVTSRVNVAIPTSVIPPLNQVINVMNLIVE